MPVYPACNTLSSGVYVSTISCSCSTTSRLPPRRAASRRGVELGGEDFIVDDDGRGHEDLVVGGGGHAVALLVHEQFLIELFAGGAGR